MKLRWTALVQVLTALMAAAFSACVREAPRPSIPRLSLPAGPEGATYAYAIGPAPEGCPNWYSALKSARRMAGCDGAGRGDPASPCQTKLRECAACDICKILEPGQGPEVVVRRMKEKGWTAPDFTRVEFGEELCNRFSFIDELAKTMVHESAHACPSVGGGPVYDRSRSSVLGRAGLGPTSPDGCTAYDITEACAGGS